MLIVYKTNVSVLDYGHTVLMYKHLKTGLVKKRYQPFCTFDVTSIV